MSILVGNSCFYPKQAGVSSKEPPEIQKKEVGLTISQKRTEKKDQILQWHPAFFAGIQIELEEDADCLELTQEYSLGTKPMAIDEKSLLLRRDISTHSVQQCPLHCVQCFQYLICCINISKFPFQ